MSETKQAWSRSALVRAISDALPGNLRVAPEQVEPLLEGLTDAALEQANRVTAADDTTNLPASELLANGQSPYTSPTGALYTTEGQFTAEHAVRAAAVVRGAATLPAAVADRLLERYAEAGVTLGDDQAAALRGVLTSGAQVEVLMAAAGTGKSFVVGAIADAWRHGDPDARPVDPDAGDDGTGPRVFGLAPYQVAADILGREGLAARNMASWLAAQRRLDHPRAPAGENPTGRPAGTSRGGCAAATSWCSTRPAPPTRRRWPRSSPAARPRAPSCCWSATRASSARSARAGRCPTSPSTASSTSWPRSAGSPTTGKGRRRCGCATAT